MFVCCQETITDKGFSHLKCIHTLDMSGCGQETITDWNSCADMHCCGQKTITGKAFSYLADIDTLETILYKQIDDAALPHIEEFEALTIKLQTMHFLISLASIH